MYRSLLLSAALFLIASGASASNAQMIKTDDGRKLENVKVTLSDLNILIGRDEEGLKKQLSMYTDDSPWVKGIKAHLDELLAKKSALEIERKALEQKELTRVLPNTTVELLKIIILQNERILDNLDAAARKRLVGP